MHVHVILNSRTSSDIMGYLQDVQIELTMLVNSRNEDRCWRLCWKYSVRCRNECHHWYPCFWLLVTSALGFKAILCRTKKEVVCPKGEWGWEGGSYVVHAKWCNAQSRSVHKRVLVSVSHLCVLEYGNTTLDYESLDMYIFTCGFLLQYSVHWTLLNGLCKGTSSQEGTRTCDAGWGSVHSNP